MDDAEVIEAFLEGASGAVFSPALNVERGTLKVEGWWAAAFRLTERTVLVRDEEPPSGSAVVTDLGQALAGRGLSPHGADFPGIVLLTYTVLDLGYAPWVLWSTDRATGEADLNAKATEESFLESSPGASAVVEAQNTDHARGARRVAGAPTRVLLAVGVSEEAALTLAGGLTDCQVERRALGEIEPADCGSLLPTLVLVDATGPAGQAFVVDVHLADSVRAPVVAVTAAGGWQAGADATVDAAAPADDWLPLVRGLLG